MFWQQNHGESLAEYSLTLALMLVVVVLTMKFIGSFAADIFTAVASSLE
jgi:Flp pilus assembly pilin Flp